MELDSAQVLVLVQVSRHVLCPYLMSVIQNYDIAKLQFKTVKNCTNCSDWSVVDLSDLNIRFSLDDYHGERIHNYVFITISIEILGGKI